MATRPRTTVWFRLGVGMLVLLPTLAACTTDGDLESFDGADAPTTMPEAEFDVKQARWVACMDDHGFPYRDMPSGAADAAGHFSFGEGQEEMFKNAVEQCTIEVMGPVEPPSPEYLSAYYDFLVELADCVKAEGFAVPDPPSKAAFIESDGALWHPYDPRWMTVTEAEWNRLNGVCPQNFAG